MLEEVGVWEESVGSWDVGGVEEKGFLQLVGAGRKGGGGVGRMGKGLSGM